MACVPFYLARIAGGGGAVWRIAGNESYRVWVTTSDQLQRDQLELGTNGHPSGIRDLDASYQTWLENIPLLPGNPIQSTWDSGLIHARNGYPDAPAWVYLSDARFDAGRAAVSGIAVDTKVNQVLTKLDQVLTKVDAIDASSIGGLTEAERVELLNDIQQVVVDAFANTLRRTSSPGLFQVQD